MQGDLFLVKNFVLGLKLEMEINAGPVIKKIVKTLPVQFKKNYNLKKQTLDNIQSGQLSW